MNILYLTMDGFDTPGPNNQMAEVMIRKFVEAGNKVHLIQSRRKRIFDDLPNSLVGLEGLEVETIDRKCIDKSNFVVRYLDEIKWAFQSFSHWRSVKDIDVVFLQSCPTAVFQLVLLKIFCGKPVLFNIYDMWPGHAMSLGVITNKFMFEALRAIQKITYKLSSVIAVLSEDMMEKVVEEGVPSAKVAIVPAWFDDSKAMEIPDAENEFLKKYDLAKNKFTVQFAGTIGYVFNYKIVLRAAELLKNEHDIRFQMIGDGLFKDKFQTEAEALGLDNIDFFPLQPIAIVPDVYSACDIEIIPLRKGVIGNGVPSKAPLLMACRKAIVNSVESNSNYYAMFNNEKLGISVDIDDAEALAKAILLLKEDESLRRELADNAFEYSRLNYSATVCVGKMLDALKSMCK